MSSNVPINFRGSQRDRFNVGTFCIYSHYRLGDNSSGKWVTPVETLPTFRMKLVNKGEEPKWVALTSLGTTAKAWSELLNRTARIQAESDTNLHWVIKNIHVASLDIETEPILIDGVEADPLPEEFWDVLARFLHSRLQRLEEGVRPEELFPDTLIQPVYDLLSSFHTDGIGTMEFQFGTHQTSTLSWDKAGQLHKEAIRLASIGSVEGTIVSLSFSRKPPYFGLKPARGRVVECRFNPDNYLERVLSAVQKRVSVFGKLIRDGNGTPIKFEEVRDLQILPADADAPTVDDLYGSDPDFTGDLSATQWVRRVRGEA